VSKHKISVRRAAYLYSICRKEINKSALEKDRLAEKIIKDFALNYPSYGYRMITAKLRLEGHSFNHKKVYRIYKKLQLNFKKSSKSRKLPARKRILEIANNSNQIWSLDFMSGSVNNRRFRTLNVIDEFARELLEIKILRSIPSNAVIDILNRIIYNQGRKPLALRIDNGSEFTSYEFTDWAKSNDIALFYIQAGKPYQNCYIERFNGTYRNEVLNKYIFDSLDELKDVTDDWLYEYNYKRPHSSLGGLPPKIFLKSQQHHDFIEHDVTDINKLEILANTS
jgi:putative transposase